MIATCLCGISSNVYLFDDRRRADQRDDPSPRPNKRGRGDVRFLLQKFPNRSPQRGRKNRFECRSSRRADAWGYVRRRSRNAFAITETELNVIAALAIIGLSTIPKNG